MKDNTIELKNFQPKKVFFIGIDSDGCVFDTMELKHKECFCPQYINHFNLQSVSKYAREVWDFVNLYSKTRGINRFKGLIRAIELLTDRKEVKERKAIMPDLSGLKAWVEREDKLGNPALEKEIEKKDVPELKEVYNWSIDVNETVEKIVRNVPPFPYARKCLETIKNDADTIVVSQTPINALEREWKENGIDSLVRLIIGQEMGTKEEHIRYTTGNNYSPEKMLMIGDAPGDLKAAKSNNALFFPIIPGKEEESWKLLYEEALEKFFNLSYEGRYEKSLIEEFDKALPENPSWEI